MSVHTLGNTTAPSAGANDSSFSEQAPNDATTITGSFYITKLFAYFGATSGSITAHLLLINSNGNGRALLADAGAMTVSGQTWQSQSLSTPFFVTGTSIIEVGFWHTGQAHFSVYGSGTWQQGNPGSPSGTSGFSTPGSPFFQGGLGYYMEYIDPLTVSGVSPSTAAAGATVTITGSGFTGGAITGVSFNTIGATATVVDDSHITATVPNGFTSGTLSVTSDHGNGSTTFTLAAPTISGATPDPAGVGQVVTVTGSGFANGSVTSVTFNGTAASSYAVVNDTSLTATVPSGATTGPLVVNTNHGSASISFTVSSARVYDGTAFQASQVYAYDGSAFQTCQVLVFDGTSWQSSD